MGRPWFYSVFSCFSAFLYLSPPKRVMYSAASVLNLTCVRSSKVSDLVTPQTIKNQRALVSYRHARWKSKILVAANVSDDPEGVSGN